jgi:hypothetical protein
MASILVVDWPMNITRGLPAFSQLELTQPMVPGRTWNNSPRSQPPVHDRRQFNAVFPQHAGLAPPHCQQSWQERDAFAASAMWSVPSLSRSRSPADQSGFALAIFSGPATSGLNWPLYHETGQSMRFNFRNRVARGISSRECRFWEDLDYPRPPPHKPAGVC